MPASPSPARAGNGGFTLVEVAVVLMLILIVITLAAPAMSRVTAQSSTRSAIRRIAADVSYARILAVREGRPVSLRIQSASTYTITVDRSATDSRTIRTVDLSRDYGALQLSPTSGLLTFDTRGLRRPATLEMIKATRGDAVDSVVILVTGRPYRDD